MDEILGEEIVATVIATGLIETTFEPKKSIIRYSLMLLLHHYG
jgi:hypothetical protein